MTRNTLHTMLQPRFAMGLAMTILSFSTVLHHGEALVQQIHPGHPHLSTIWVTAEHKAMCVQDQVLKYYKDIRLVYQLERQLKDLQDHECSGEQRETYRRTGWNDTSEALRLD